MRFKNLEKYRTGGSGSQMTLGIALPRTPDGRVYRFSPNELAHPRHFVLGSRVEWVAVPEQMTPRMTNAPGTAGDGLSIQRHGRSRQGFHSPGRYCRWVGDRGPCCPRRCRGGRPRNVGQGLSRFLRQQVLEGDDQSPVASEACAAVYEKRSPQGTRMRRMRPGLRSVCDLSLLSRLRCA